MGRGRKATVERRPVVLIIIAERSQSSSPAGDATERKKSESRRRPRVAPSQCSSALPQHEQRLPAAFSNLPDSSANALNSPTRFPAHLSPRPRSSTSPTRFPRPPARRQSIKGHSGRTTQKERTSVRTVRLPCPCTTLTQWSKRSPASSAPRGMSGSAAMVSSSPESGPRVSRRCLRNFFSLERRAGRGREKNAPERRELRQ